MEKAKSLVEKVVLKRVKEPALNKWTKVDPAMCQATIMAVFFRVVTMALEWKVNMSYGDLAAMAPGVAEGQDEEDPVQGDQENWKGQLKRFGKRCLMFIGDPETKTRLLVWTVIGEPLMILHYKFFKHVNFMSHCSDDQDRLSIFNFCPGCTQSNDSNPAKKALKDVALMIFDPNGEASVLIAPLKAAFGATVNWSVKLLDTYQKSCILGYCRLWRSFIHTFKCFPWQAACIFDPSAAPVARETASKDFWNAPPCHIDPFLGDPLRNELCHERTDLFEKSLQDFVYALLMRCMITSTFGERIFAHLTQWTGVPRSRPALCSVASLHVNQVFDGFVQQWWQSLLDATGTKPTDGRSRDLVAYTRPRGAHTCAWHCYTKGRKGSVPDSQEGDSNKGRIASMEAIRDVNAKRQTWTELDPANRAEWEEKARKCRAEARGRGAAVDKLLATQKQSETAGGPWGLSCRHGDLPGAWPLSRFVVSRAMAEGNLQTTAKSWRNDNCTLWSEDGTFPETADLREACIEGPRL